MRLGQTSFIYFISQILASIVGFVATVYFTRTLGEEVYGFYAITLALVSWLGIIKNIGFGNAIIKRMSEGKEPYAYLAAGTSVKIFLLSFVILGVFVFRENVNNYIGEPVYEFVILILLATILSGLINSGLKGMHKVHIYAILSPIKQLARAVLMILFVIFGWQLTGMLLGHALGTIFVTGVGLIIIRPQLVIPQRQHIVSLFEYAKFSWLGSMRKKTFSDMDILVLGFFVSAGLTGVYAVAYTLAKFIDLFGDAISTTLFPEMSKLDAEDDKSMVGTLTNDALAFAGLFLIPGIIGATIIGDRLMRVYGPGFERGETILVILILSLVFYSFTKQLLNTLNAIDRPDLAFRANGLFIISNLFLNITLVWQIGWVGAGIATMTSAMVGLIASFYYTRLHVDFRLPVAEIGRQTLAAGVMGVAVYGVRMLGEKQPIADHNTVFVVSLIGFGAAVYFVILFVLSSRLRTTIDRNLPFITRSTK